MAIALWTATDAPTAIGDACQYLGCEDAASGQVTVHDIDAMAEVALCRNHQIYVEVSLSSARRVWLLDDIGGRGRVGVAPLASR